MDDALRAERPERVLLLATYSQALSSFVAPFARYLEQHGYDVAMGASEEEGTAFDAAGAESGGVPRRDRSVHEPRTATS